MPVTEDDLNRTHVALDPTGQVAICGIGDVFVSMWIGDNTQRQWRWFADEAERFFAGKPGGAIQLMVVQPSSPPPDDAAREILNKHFATLGSGMRRLVAVVLGESIRTTMVRTIARSFLILSGQARQLKICENYPTAVQLVREVARVDTPSPAELSGTIAALENALGVHS